MLIQIQIDHDDEGGLADWVGAPFFSLFGLSLRSSWRSSLFGFGSRLRLVCVQAMAAAGAFSTFQSHSRRHSKTQAHVSEFPSVFEHVRHASGKGSRRRILECVS